MEKELKNMRLGFLTLYILKYIKEKPKLGMIPFAAMVAQEIEEKTKLRAGKSLVFSRLNHLCVEGYLQENWGVSSNPNVKKKVKFYSISKEGIEFIETMKTEQKRINQVLDRLPL